MSAATSGRRVGSYRIGEPIGGGAMGRVWRGVDEALGRPVAVKMLRADLAHRPGLTERFRVEARALARLAHPNIAMVYALVEEHDDLYLVMEHVEGETLQSQLDRSGPLELGDCFAIFHRAVDGIQHAHEAGVIHRDIKPSNLMLGTNGAVKWIDFGIAHVRGRERLTGAGSLVGTPEYMAPEQVRGEPATVRSDVYSLGVLLFKMLAGRPPFTGAGDFEVMRAQAEATPPRPNDAGARLDPALEETLLRALEKDPAARFPSAAAFRRALVDAGAPERELELGGLRSAVQAPGFEETTQFDTGSRPPAAALARTGSPDPAILAAEPVETRSLPLYEQDRIATRDLEPPEPVRVKAEILPPEGLGALAPPPRRRPSARSRLRHLAFVLAFAVLSANWITPWPFVGPPIGATEPSATTDAAAAPATADEAQRIAARTEPATEPKRRAPSPPPAPEARGWKIRR